MDKASCLNQHTSDDDAGSTQAALDGSADAQVSDVDRVDR
jgi:hypothetical protein